MAGDELFGCRGCGAMFLVRRPTHGPLAGYCSQVCRQRAYRDRMHRKVATEAAALASTAPPTVLVSCLVASPPALALSLLRDLLRDALERNLATASGDELCTSDTPPDPGVVADVHKEL